MTDLTDARAPHPRSFRSVAEPLWVAALGLQFVLIGPFAIRGLIRLIGRAGQVETVEWAVHMAFLFAFLPAAWIIGWVIPRVGSERAGAWVRRVLVIAAGVEGAVYLLGARPSLALAGLAASSLTAAALYIIASRRDTKNGIPLRPAIPVALATGALAWMSAGALVHWESALDWAFASSLRVAIVIASVAVVAVAVDGWRSALSTNSRLRLVDFVALGILVAFSFRTFPMIEFYHWSFFVGPIEQLRHGGTLLYDTPSQYGFLSIIIPALLPGGAWQSFWFFQGTAYAIVAAIMYLGVRRLFPGFIGPLAALAVTFTTVFFRPRSASLLLPGQMTPGAGPVRFVWCFVLLAFILAYYLRPPHQRSDRAFVIGGTVIWAVSLLWSAETAIYVTAIWFPAYFLHAVQRTAQSLQAGKSRATAARTAALWAFLPIAVAAFTALAVAMAFRIGRGFGPDTGGYLEYVLLYSRAGYGALPIDPTGTVWFLILVFLAVSTVLVLHALRDPRDFRLPLWAAAWGSVWAVASYFTGRSHPANLLSITPLLLYSLTVVLLLKPFEGSSIARYVIASVILPLFAFPVAVTAGHESFARAVTIPQVSPAQFTEQLPVMEPELQNLLVSAGAKPEDSFVFVGDGRLVLPAWRITSNARAQNPGATRLMSDRSWLPRPFEIIGSLPRERRQLYLERNAYSFPHRGWLVENRRDTARNADHMLDFERRARREEARFESAGWIVTLLGPAGSALSPPDSASAAER